MQDLEIHQLRLPYAKLRRRNARKERQLVASLATKGQQFPAIVIHDGEAGTYVLVDGYKRIRALKTLRQDTVRVTLWDLEEVDAVLLERLMRNSEADSALEQGWLLEELNERCGLTHDELARRFDKSQSWVSRRLALVRTLPPQVQERVLNGTLPAHAAMRFMVPMARAKRDDCVRLVKALAALRPSTREVAVLYTAWVTGDPQTRELVVTQPAVVLKAHAEARSGPSPEPKTPGRQLVDDFGILVGVSRRARSRLSQGLLAHLLPTEQEQARRMARQARQACDALFGCASALLDGTEATGAPADTAGAC